MSKIAKHFFMTSPVLDLATFAMVIFMLIFVAVVLHTIKRERRDLDDLAHIPLHDQDKGAGQ